MKKGKLICIMFLRETAALCLTLVSTYIPGKLIDQLLGENHAGKIALLVAVIACSYFLCNFVIKYCNNRIDYGFCVIRDKIVGEEASKFANARLDKFEKLCKYRNVLAEFGSRDSLRKEAEAVVAILSKLCLAAALIVFPPRLPVYFYIVVGVLAGIGAGADVLYKRLDYSLRQQYADNQESLYQSIWAMTKSCYAKEIRIFQLKSFTERKYNEARNDLYDILDRKNKKGMKIDLLPAMVKGMEILAAFGFAALYFVQGNATAGTFVICVSLMQRFFEGVSVIGKSIVTIADEKRYEREFEAFCTEDDGCHESGMGCEFGEDWKIEFRNVSFSYPDSDKEALSNLNLTIRKGDKISIVGGNGAGKSTFVRLLMGMYKPTQGTICINGVDLESLNVKEYQKHFTAIYQDFTIFDYSILENIAMKDEEYREELLPAVKETIGKLAMSEMIDRMKNGLDTKISRRFDTEGIDLSGGERQKLALARALHKEAEVVVFDEPTSAMSPMAENQMYKLYEDFSKEKTVVFISHRLAGCRMSDRILVFWEGSLAEEGSHEELMRDGGLYYRMFTTQAENYGQA